MDRLSLVPTATRARLPYSQILSTGLEISSPTLPQPYPYRNLMWPKNGILQRKTSNELKSFDGVSANYRQWNTRVRDHCQLVNPGWRRILDEIEAQTCPVNWALIHNSYIDVLTAGDLILLAHDLWSFLGTVMTDAIHPRRDALAGGEAGNGFELWRRLYFEHEGGSTQVHLMGIRFFTIFHSVST